MPTSSGAAVPSGLHGLLTGLSPCWPPLLRPFGRVDAKPHCDIKDTGHGSNGNGHGSNNGNGHGSNGNGSNGSSDNKNGGNGNSATKGDGNGHGSNGNGASTTLAVDRHYQALVNTAEGKMPPNLAGAHDTLPVGIPAGS